MKSFSNTRKHLQESVLLYAFPETQPEKLKNDSDPKFEKNTDNVMVKIKSSVENNVSEFFKLEDGTVVEITPNEAKNVVYTYEELNDDNQKIFESMIGLDISYYQKFVCFCEEYIG